MLYRIEKYQDVVKLLSPMVITGAERLLLATSKHNDNRPKQLKQLVTSLMKTDQSDARDSLVAVAGVLNEIVYRLFKVWKIFINFILI